MPKISIETVTAGFRLSASQMRLIEKLIELGFYKDKTDFFQNAVSAKLEAIFQGTEDAFEEKLRKYKDMAKLLELMKS